MAKNLQSSHLYLFFLNKDPLEIEKQKSICTSFGAILLCTFKPKVKWQLRKPIRFEKRLTKDGQMDRRMVDDSALDELYWLCQQRS